MAKFRLHFFSRFSWMSPASVAVFLIMLVEPSFFAIVASWREDSLFRSSAFPARLLSGFLIRPQTYAPSGTTGKQALTLTGMARGRPVAASTKTQSVEPSARSLASAGRLNR